MPRIFKTLNRLELQIAVIRWCNIHWFESFLDPQSVRLNINHSDVLGIKKDLAIQFVLKSSIPSYKSGFEIIPSINQVIVVTPKSILSTVEKKIDADHGILAVENNNYDTYPYANTVRYNPKLVRKARKLSNQKWSVDKINELRKIANKQTLNFLLELHRAKYYDSHPSSKRHTHT